MIHNDNKGIFAIIIASFLWGTTGTIASYAPNISPFAIGAFSMGLGGVLLVISARKTLLNNYKKMLAKPKLLFFGAISVAVYPLAFYSSMRLSGVAIGTVISISTAPFFAAILERLLNKKTITLQWILSFMLGSVGIILLALGKDDSVYVTHQLHQHSLGILLGCMAGFAYAGYSWAAKNLIESGVHAQSSMSGLFGLASLILLPSLFFTGEHLFSSASNTFISLYMAVIPMFLGYILFSYGLNYIEASKATLITLIEPLIATLLAIIIIGEKFTMIGWFGGILVSLCLLIQTYKIKKTAALPL
ncbi:EamA family transporter [Thalassotalea sp. 1_MG-2023]|uniref:DMT family transporter n=1 Tax=Thalassotalea sp. 1_MG-2023 TaxID=3062680 RepID=UPI0026E1BB44|nr:EamA family transporter [Thalassotalea sp. 1_MG-2023]MDO6427376.1 EamA family transporter [Thalassotalea sp. 1_MG-2023]